MSRIPVLIAGSNCLSGVITWAERLRQSLANHPRYDVKLLSVDKRPLPGADIAVRTCEDAEAVIRGMGPTILMPNYLWDLYMAGFDPNVRCIGMCHADSDEQYYRPLSWYEPVISQFVAVSPQCSEQLKQRLHLRVSDIATLPYGINVPRQPKRATHAGPLRIIYAGRVTQLQKRVWDFVPLLEQLEIIGVPFTFDVYGDGDQLEPLSKAIKSRFPRRAIKFHGRVPLASMKDVWAAHDVFVQVSDFEGTSISMLEAMAEGVTPVVTAASSGVEGVISAGTNGFVAPVGDMVELAQMLARLAKDRSLLARMSVAAHNTAQAFSQETYLEKFVPLLDQAMRPRASDEIYQRYGMFAGSHPLFKQQRAIVDLQNAARSHSSSLGSISRLFSRAGRRAWREERRRVA